MPKEKRRKKRQRHDPLLKQMTQDPGYLRKPKKPDGVDDFDDGDDVKDQKMESNWVTKRVLENVREQQLEIAREEGRVEANGEKATTGQEPSARRNEDSDDEMLDENHEDDEYEEIEVSPEDERMLSMFMSDSKSKRRTLADIIMEKIAEHEAMIKAKGSEAVAAANQIPDKVRDVYSRVGQFLSHYTSGKVPKVFKIIPNMRNWEDVLALTSPENWTSQAMFIATRMFASSTSERVAQKFYMLVLLPRIRQDIESHKRLNYHLYRSVKKAIFKPTAFFRGLLLPMAMDCCTLREAVIMCSILSKCSIPVLYASVAMMKLAVMKYEGTQTLFLKTLLSKKYNLPFQVIKALMQHFMGFSEETRRLPVVWHQCLLVFVQRYKKSLTSKQIRKIRTLSRKQQHHMISIEIRRELASVADKELQSMDFGSAGRRSRSGSIKMSTE
mmetsp:Transcript_12999/g.20848  ORF Transcript_12999/g.20848 Transcript_12999/m.20848 type:complete len:442 (+) Transcript_12999:77-1402(+)|eukprot:jgi/Bigna1/48687/estExt_Genewise1.C_300117